MPKSPSLTFLPISVALRHVHVYGIVLIDPEGTVQGWNDGACELLGYSESEAIGRHFEFIFTDEDRAREAPRTEMEIALQRNYSYDDRWHRRKDGSSIYVNGGLAVLRDENSEMVGFIKIIRDETGKKERTDHIRGLNEQLEEAHRSLKDYAGHLAERVAERTRELNERNAELEAFCYSIAHDLRAPLRSIQTMSEIVVEDYGPALDPTCRDYLQRITRAGRRLDRLTLDLLRYSRLSRDEIELTTVELEPAVNEVLASLQETISGRGAEIVVQRPLPAVNAQHAYLVQILTNFVSNALKFVEPGTKPVVKISAELRGSRVRIVVRDNGIGIPDEYREKIFLLFERLHPDSAYEGTGVGLAIAHKAAVRLNGTIGLEPFSGEGSSFWLELERARTEPPAAA